MADNPIPKRITEEKLRELFNENYLDRIKKGEIEERVMRGAGRHPSLALSHEPFCTQSQEIWYFDLTTGQELARAHRYLRPDGTIGASGMPDPKRLFLNGELYRIIKKKNRP